MNSGGSAIKAEILFNRRLPPSYPCYCQGSLVWQESLASEGGRAALLRQAPDGNEICITPEGFKIGSKVHEYGGKCFAIQGDVVYFNNEADGRIYRQSVFESEQPQSIVDVDDNYNCAFADFEVFDSGRKMLAVREKRYQDKENVNSICWLSLDSQHSKVQDLVCDADFVARPCVSPDGSKVAWMEWNHPDMPWDSSKIKLGDLHCDADTVRVENIRLVAGGEGRSVCQPGFLSHGMLCFAMDSDADAASYENFWNLHQWSADAGVVLLTQDCAEYGEPHWNFGNSRWVEFAPGLILAVRSHDVGEELVRLNLQGEIIKVDAARLNRFQYLSKNDEENARHSVILVAGSPENEPEIYGYNHQLSIIEPLQERVSLLAKDQISEGRSIWFKTRDKDRAHAFFYAPVDRSGSQPGPLMVLVHGGPTARTDSVLSPEIQYWTSRGFAVIDVNHRGSSGFGRAFRQQLRGKWGVVDINDVDDAIEYAIQEGIAARDQVCIRGKSAGGYVVLRMLTEYPQRIAVGVSYYGIGNLITLAELTHKFESRYLDSLLGEAYHPERAKTKQSVYQTRSPAHYFKRIESALILFQGLQDAIVPSQISREIVEELGDKNIPLEYYEYENEGHGFRITDNKIDALNKETNFIMRVV